MRNPGSRQEHPALRHAAQALRQNQLDEAGKLLVHVLQDHPDDVRAVAMMAELAWRSGQRTAAEQMLRKAVQLAPGFAPARSRLASHLLQSGRAAEALLLIEDLIAECGDSIGNLRLKASALAKLGKFDEAIALYEDILAQDPSLDRVWNRYGHMLRTVGRLPEAIVAYRRAIALKPGSGAPWFYLSNLKTIKFDHADATAMRNLLRDPEISDEDRIHVEFALGKAEHDFGRVEQAFAHFAAGNALRRKAKPYDPSRLSRAVDRSIEGFDQAFFAGRPGGHDARDPIFIVGLPRAGSTLIEQILSSHSQVEGTSELQDIPLLADRGSDYIEVLRGLSEGERLGLGRQYIERTMVQRRTNRPRFIDKFPKNWLYISFIQIVLPNAKIIDARRHPLGCGFSNFRQHFAHGQDYAYDLSDIGHYYSDYVRMMAHFDKVLPGRIHRVQYERMVNDTESEIRALLEYCELEFEPACLDFHRTKRGIPTPSSEQVRQPIYQTATEDWRPYEPFLGPLKEALGEVLTAYPDAPASFAR